MSNQHDLEVVLVRHGETAWSKSGQHTGRTDVPLTEEGRRAARLVGGALQGRTFDKVLVSPLSRAVETCLIAGLGSRAEVRDDLREWDYGDYEGMTTPEIQTAQPNWSVWIAPLPGGETLEAIGSRCDRVISELRGAKGSSVLFSHGHLLRILASRWLGLPANCGRFLALDTAAISVLGYERVQPVIVLWNSLAHLGAELQ